MKKSWIPNGLSLGNLICGFLAIIVASYDFEASHLGTDKVFLISGLLILIAALFDGLDGPAARMLKVESSLGGQLDSLGDLTTFGLAPGFIMYKMYLEEIKFNLPSLGLYNIPAGMILSTIYPACAAYRLARFNVSHDSTAFTGLPTPIAGVFIAILAISYRQYQLPFFAAAIILFSLAVLMVSNIRYSKPQASMKENFTYFKLALVIAIFITLIVFLEWYWALFTVMFLYVLSGFIALSLELFQKIKYVLGSPDK